MIVRFAILCLGLVGVVSAARAADEAVFPPAFVGTWVGDRRICEAEGGFGLSDKGWVEGEDWMCELIAVKTLRQIVTGRARCVSEQSSERAERELVVETRRGRPWRINGQRVLRCP